MYFRRFIVAAVALFAFSPAFAGETVLGMATIVDGNAVLIRGVERYRLVEGAQIEAADVIEVADIPGVLQIEIFDGGVVQLSAGSRLMLAAPEGGVEPSIYVLQGWLKIINPGVQNVYPAKVYTPTLIVHPSPGSVVIQAEARHTRVFAETGDTEVADPGTTLGRRVGSGQFYHSIDGRANRPSRDFLASVPRTLRDSIPARLTRMRAKAVAMVRMPDIVYADVAAWLQAEAALRSVFVQRWAAKTGDADFRAALVQNINLHPEWKAVLNPSARSLADASKRGIR